MNEIDKLENMALLARSGLDWQDRLEEYKRQLFLSAPALLAEVRRLRNERDEARKEYEELLRRTEKREEAERIVNAGSLPSHLERAEDRELDRLRAIEAAARAYCDLTPERADETPAPLLFAKLQAALAAKNTP
ncbi:MAG: hypothetical protein INH34_18085 [Phycisphaerales bacterium]|nr:hypothetical protein [Phycisphaerales bacterium]